MDGVEPIDGTSSGSATLSRRSAVLRLGSGGLAALLASSGIPAAAQEVSPMAGKPAAEGKAPARRRKKAAGE